MSPSITAGENGVLRAWGILLLLVLAQCARGAGAASELALKVPPGFEVSLYAGDALAHDIYCLTVDPQGRVVVSGPGYIKTLLDPQHRGRAERAELLSAVPKSGAFGLCFAGDDLLYTGDDGLWRIPHVAAAGPRAAPEKWAALKSTEHGAHAIVQGPDGWFYVNCGNEAHANESLVNTHDSWIANPLAGCVLRFSPNGQQCACVADGLRNACGLAFNAEGSLFTVDSDGERDQYLPWYMPTRLFELRPGGHHGWVNAGWQSSWSRPASWYDSVPPLVRIGRGSPTGVAVYRHTAFPERYRGGVFSCCWTLGRVYFFPLRRDGAGYSAEKEIFLESLGGSGFAPTDMAVGPAGELYVATGGRGTQGSVYVVRPTAIAAAAPARDALTEVLAAPEPLAAWSRAKWMPAAKEFGETPFRRALADTGRSSAERLRAVEILTELYGGCAASDVEHALAARDPEVVSRAAWSYCRQHEPGDAALLLTLFTHSDSRVVTATWEALPRLPLAAFDWSPAEWQRVAEHIASERAWSACARAFAHTNGGVEKLPAALQPAEAYREPCRADTFAALVDQFRAAPSAGEQLFYVRWMLRALGDVNSSAARPAVFMGYAPRAPERVPVNGRGLQQMAAAFPTTDAELNRELARLLGVLEVDAPELVERIAAMPNERTSVPDDLHYLIVLARLPGPRSPAATRATAAALAQLQHKMALGEMYASRNWPDRVEELFAALCRRDGQLAAALVADRQFTLPSQALFALQMPPALQVEAARRLLAAVKPLGEVRWTPEFVRLVAVLPAEESLPALRAQWGDATLRDTLLLALAKGAAAEDRTRFLAGLASADAQVVEVCAAALGESEAEASADDFAAVVRALQQYCQAPKYTGLRQHLVALLEAWSEEAFEIDDHGQDDLRTQYEPWFAWFAQHYPEAAAKLHREGRIDLAAWSERLENVPWDGGVPERGRLVFEQRSCFKCHAGASRFGPDLAGAAGRFSRRDLFTAILDPNKDVSPVFRTMQVVTGGGKVTVGMIVYESPESTLVQTGPAETVRIAGEEIVALQPSRQSLMPEGLLNGASDAELADLYAYLKTLQGGK